MKLHLPSALRKGLLSCMAAIAGICSLTIGAGALPAGICVLALQSSAYATEITDENYTLDQATYEELLDFCGGTNQNVSITSHFDATGGMSISRESTVYLSSTLEASADNRVIGNANITISADSTLVVKNPFLFTADQTHIIAEGNAATARVVLDLGSTSEHTLNNALYSSFFNDFRGKFVLRTGRLEGVGNNANANHTIEVEDGAQLLVGSVGGPYYFHMILNGHGYADQTGAHRGALRFTQGRTTRGNTTLTGDTSIAISGNVYSQGHLYANGHTLSILEDGLIDFSHTENKVTNGHKITNLAGINVGTATVIFSKILDMDGQGSTLAVSGSTGTLTLSGTIINAGTLEVNSGTVILSSDISTAAAGGNFTLDMKSGSTTRVVGDVALNSSDLTLKYNSYTSTPLTIGQNDETTGSLTGIRNLTFSGSLDNSSKLTPLAVYAGSTLSGTGIFSYNQDYSRTISGSGTISGFSTYNVSAPSSGNLTINPQITYSGTSVEFAVSKGTLILNGALSVTGNMVKTGGSTLTLNGNTTVTGSIDVQQGVLNLGDSGAANGRTNSIFAQRISVQNGAQANISHTGINAPNME